MCVPKTPAGWQPRPVYPDRTWAALSPANYDVGPGHRPLTNCRTEAAGALCDVARDRRKWENSQQVEKQYYPKRRGFAALDLGCGANGFNALLLGKGQARDTLCVDTHHFNTLSVTSIAAERGSHAMLWDVRMPSAMPLPDGSFDLVHARWSLWFLSAAELETFLLETLRLLRAGGTLLIDQPDVGPKLLEIVKRLPGSAAGLDVTLNGSLFVARKPVQPPRPQPHVGKCGRSLVRALNSTMSLGSSDGSGGIVLGIGGGPAGAVQLGEVRAVCSKP